MIELSNENVDFETWYVRLQTIARHFQGSCADLSEWREDYNAGLTPETSWYDAWDERMPEEL